MTDRSDASRFGTKLFSPAFILQRLRQYLLLPCRQCLPGKREAADLPCKLLSRLAEPALLRNFRQARPPDNTTRVVCQFCRKMNEIASAPRRRRPPFPFTTKLVNRSTGADSAHLIEYYCVSSPPSHNSAYLGSVQAILSIGHFSGSGVRPTRNTYPKSANSKKPGPAGRSFVLIFQYINYFLTFSHPAFCNFFQLTAGSETVQVGWGYMRSVTDGRTHRSKATRKPANRMSDELCVSRPVGGATHTIARPEQQCAHCRTAEVCFVSGRQV